MPVSKAKLISVVRYNVGTNILRSFLKSELGKSAKMKDLEAGLDLLNQNFTRDQIEDFIFNYFYTLKHHTYIYETDDLSEFNQNSLVRKIGGEFVDITEDIGELSAVDTNKMTLYGFAFSTVRGQKFDESNGQYTGQSKNVETFIPFVIEYHPPFHTKLKVSKFVPSIIHDSNGSDLSVLENHFDESSLARVALEKLINIYSTSTFIRSELTTSIKNLVQDQRIGTQLARAQDANGIGVEQRTINRGRGNTSFVEKDWHNQYLISSPRIGRTKWYWLEKNNPSPDSTRGLISHTIDPNEGKVSQDTFSKEDLEDYVNEIISRNS